MENMLNFYNYISSSGDHSCLYMSWQPIHELKYSSLDQNLGATQWPADRLISPPVFVLKTQLNNIPLNAEGDVLCVYFLFLSFCVS